MGQMCTGANDSYSGMGRNERLLLLLLCKGATKYCCCHRGPLCKRGATTDCCCGVKTCVTFERLVEIARRSVETAGRPGRHLVAHIAAGSAGAPLLILAIVSAPVVQLVPRTFLLLTERLVPRLVGAGTL